MFPLFWSTEPFYVKLKHESEETLSRSMYKDRYKNGPPFGSSELEEYTNPPVSCWLDDRWFCICFTRDIILKSYTSVVQGTRDWETDISNSELFVSMEMREYKGEVTFTLWSIDNVTYVCHKRKT